MVSQIRKCRHYEHFPMKLLPILWLIWLDFRPKDINEDNWIASSYDIGLIRNICNYSAPLGFALTGFISGWCKTGYGRLWPIVLQQFWVSWENDQPNHSDDWTRPAAAFSQTDKNPAPESQYTGAGSVSDWSLVGAENRNSVGTTLLTTSLVKSLSCFDEWFAIRQLACAIDRSAEEFFVPKIPK